MPFIAWPAGKNPGISLRRRRSRKPAMDAGWNPRREDSTQKKRGLARSTALRIGSAPEAAASIEPEVRGGPGDETAPRREKTWGTLRRPPHAPGARLRPGRCPEPKRPEGPPAPSAWPTGEGTPTLPLIGREGHSLRPHDSLSRRSLCSEPPGSLQFRFRELKREFEGRGLRIGLLLNKGTYPGLPQPVSKSHPGMMQRIPLDTMTGRD